MLRESNHTYGEIIELHEQGFSVEEIEKELTRRHEEKISEYMLKNKDSIEKFEEFISYVDKYGFFTSFSFNGIINIYVKSIDQSTRFKNSLKKEIPTLSLIGEMSFYKISNNNNSNNKYQDFDAIDVVSVKSFDEAIEYTRNFDYTEKGHDIYEVAFLIEDEEFIETIKETYLNVFANK